MTKEAPPAAGRTQEFTTHSGADTIDVGRKLARLLKPPQLLVLRGDLGTGKTTLVKGIAQALDAAEPAHRMLIIVGKRYHRRQGIRDMSAFCNIASVVCERHI